MSGGMQNRFNTTTVCRGPPHAALHLIFSTTDEAAHRTCWLSQDPTTKEILRYKGWDETLAFVKDYIGLHGPFDGFWAFSQASYQHSTPFDCSYNPPAAFLAAL